MHLPPAPGDPFSVPGRQDLLEVAQLIASFTHEDSAQSLYIVQTPAGARWVVFANGADDGPRWIGRAVPAETSEIQD